MSAHDDDCTGQPCDSAGDDLDRLIRALPPAPPPPPFSRIAARLSPREGDVAEAAARVRHLRRRVLWTAAAAAVVAGLSVAFLGSGRHEAAPGPTAISLVPISGAVRVVRRGTEVAWGDAREGDTLSAEVPSRVRIGERVTATLARGTGLLLGRPGTVLLWSGTAGFEVAHEAAASLFVVSAWGREIADRGTRFVVSLVDPQSKARGRVAVAVEEGSVSVDGVAVAAGEGASVEAARVGEEGRDTANPIPLSRPEVTLSVASGPVLAGKPTLLGLHLVNRSPLPQAWPAWDDVSLPLLLEVTDPAGTSRSYRVTRDAVVSEGTIDPFLAPAPPSEEGKQATAHLLTVRFATLFPVRGTYRLRAVYPADERTPTPPSPPLPPLLVEAR